MYFWLLPLFMISNIGLYCIVAIAIMYFWLLPLLILAHFRENPHIQIESGFYDLYTTKEDHCRYFSFSARQQVLAEVKRLVERYKGEELSITVTGHSLGAALAILTAYDLAEMRVNVVRSDDAMKKIPITVFSFASPRVGNLRFKERCDKLGVKVLRVINVHDKVPTMPGLIANEKFRYQKYLEEKVHFPWSYAHVGTELALDHTHSPFLSPDHADMASAHNLEAHLHLVDGFRGKGRRFSLANKQDIALVNKDSSLLKAEYGVPPFWRQDHNKGMIRNKDGRWVIPERPALGSRLIPLTLPTALRKSSSSPTTRSMWPSIARILFIGIQLNLHYIIN